MGNLYDVKFYEMVKNTSEYSSVKVLNVLKQKYHGEIKSVVDLGCGVGAWLKSATELWDDLIIKGYDGEYAIDNLIISPAVFKVQDLREKVIEEKRYDLAICMEVAEHLEEQYADVIVDSLCSLSNLILFSAAIPLQGGTGHVNEQPLSYWKNKFESREYVFLDIIRQEIWNDEDVSFWFKQNVVVFCKKESEEFNSIEHESIPVIDIVHPELLKKARMRDYQYHHRKEKTVNKLFDGLSNNGIAIRMGGEHTIRLLNLLSLENKNKISYIIDDNDECKCKRYNIPIISTKDVQSSTINTIVLSSYKYIDLLREEAKRYPKSIQVIDIYKYLDEINFYEKEL